MDFCALYRCKIGSYRKNIALSSVKRGKFCRSGSSIRVEWLHDRRAGPHRSPGPDGPDGGDGPGAGPRPSWPTTASRTSPISSSTLAGSCTSTQYDPAGETIDWRKPCGRSVAVSTTSWRWPGRPESCRSTSPKSGRRHGSDGPSVSRPEERGVPTPPTVPDTLTTTTATRPVRLDDKYAATSGRVLLSGIEALVRLMIDQRRLDRARGLNTGVFVSGYEGSPLGGLDLELYRAPRLLDEAGVVFTPGVNEELAATAVAGTQLLGELPRPAARRRRRVLVRQEPGPRPGGRRHPPRQLLGHDAAGRRGGGGRRRPVLQVLDAAQLVRADGPEPGRPVLAPASVADILALGLHAVALSRHAGVWTGLKIVADIADGVGDGRPRRPGRARDPRTGPRPDQCSGRCWSGRRRSWPRRTCSTSGSPGSSTTPAGRAQPGHLRARPCPAWPSSPRALAYAAVAARAARTSDSADADRDALGLRLVRLGLPWPLDAAELRAPWSPASDEVLVVEDKAAFVEGQVKAALYGQPDRRASSARSDGGGRPLCPVGTGRSTSELVATALGARCARDERSRPRLAARRRPDEAGRHGSRLSLRPPLPARTPYFCSGCPHNRLDPAPTTTSWSAWASAATSWSALDGDGRGQPGRHDPDGRRGGAVDRHGAVHRRRATTSRTWATARSSTPGRWPSGPPSPPGSTITYKLLYNDAVAMTGGQHPAGAVGVPDADPLAGHRGRTQVVVTTPDPATYRRRRLAPASPTVRHRDELADVQPSWPRAPGVTVLIHDDRCAAEERRLRNRGQAADPDRAVWINQRVCEGCGDCGEQVDLPVGRARRDRVRPQDRHPPGIVQPGLSCLDGDCPSFVVVTPPRERRRRRGEPSVPPGGDRAARPCPHRRWTSRRRRCGRPTERPCIRMPGIGGTGVVTVSRILQMARPPRRPLRRRRRADRPRPEGRAGRRRRPHRRPTDRGHRPGRTPVPSTCCSASTSSARPARPTWPSSTATGPSPSSTPPPSRPRRWSTTSRSPSPRRRT